MTAKKSTTWIVSRHPGALEWVRKHKIDGVFTPHLTLSQLTPGDCVIGNLPIQMVRELCAMSVAYYHISVMLTAEERGQELSCGELEALGARLERFYVMSSAEDINNG